MHSRRKNELREIRKAVERDTATISLRRPRRKTRIKLRLLKKRKSI